MTDTERLDYLQRICATVYCGSARTHWVVVDETKSSRQGILGDTLRDAIDAAMQKPQEGITKGDNDGR